MARTELLKIIRSPQNKKRELLLAGQVGTMKQTQISLFATALMNGE
jgi:hypothetical protein